MSNSNSNDPEVPITLEPDRPITVIIGDAFDSDEPTHQERSLAVIAECLATIAEAARKASIEILKQAAHNVGDRGAQ